jgi:hypothetical protein
MNLNTMTISISDTQHTNLECSYAECLVFLNVILSVVTQSAVVPNKAEFPITVGWYFPLAIPPKTLLMPLLNWIGIIMPQWRKLQRDKKVPNNLVIKMAYQIGPL